MDATLATTFTIPAEGGKANSSASKRQSQLCQWKATILRALSFLHGLLVYSSLPSFPLPLQKSLSLLCLGRIAYGFAIAYLSCIDIFCLFLSPSVFTYPENGTDDLSHQAKNINHQVFITMSTVKKPILPEKNMGLFRNGRICQCRTSKQ